MSSFGTITDVYYLHIGSFLHVLQIHNISMVILCLHMSLDLFSTCVPAVDMECAVPYEIHIMVATSCSYNLICYI